MENQQDNGNLNELCDNQNVEYIPVARPVDRCTDHYAAIDFCPMLLGRLTGFQSAVHLFALVASFVAALFCSGTILSAIIIAKGADPATALKTDPILNLGITLFAWAVLIIVGISLLYAAGTNHRAAGVTLKGFALNLPLGGLVTIASFITFLLSIGFMYLIWPEGYEDMKKNPEHILEMIPDMSSGGLLLLMMGVGICEEIVFRGLFMVHFRRITGSWTISILICSTGFALMHISTQEVATCIPLFGVAILWSLVTVWRRSVIPAVIGHALFNFIQISFLLLDRSQNIPLQ